ncbi:hypothetical protein AAZV13_10G171800 [Glycine max]
MDYFLEFKKYTKELTSLLACKSVEEMVTQQNKLIALSQLSSLDSEFEVVRSQILSSQQVDTLTDVFSWVMQSSFEDSHSTPEGDSLDHFALAVQSRRSWWSWPWSRWRSWWTGDLLCLWESVSL